MVNKEILENSKSIQVIKAPAHAKDPHFRKQILIFIILIFVLILVFVYVSFWQNGYIKNITQVIRFRNSYQAVFLSNGQVYFGKTTEFTNKYIVLNSPYYIQMSQTEISKDNPQPEMKLIAIKDEFHKPKDFMLIEKSSVIFIEELRDTSQIVDIIENY
jgi:hypothetical protein